uniref:Putative secreted protein n=1 Tax=Ixodes ricinus TaxID=34613 RepID=A0A6B0UFQ2_IXORI
MYELLLFFFLLLSTTYILTKKKKTVVYDGSDLYNGTTYRLENTVSGVKALDVLLQLLTRHAVGVTKRATLHCHVCGRKSAILQRELTRLLETHFSSSVSCTM